MYLRMIVPPHSCGRETINHYLRLLYSILCSPPTPTYTYKFISPLSYRLSECFPIAIRRHALVDTVLSLQWHQVDTGSLLARTPTLDHRIVGLHAVPHVGGGHGRAGRRVGGRAFFVNRRTTHPKHGTTSPTHASTK